MLLDEGDFMLKVTQSAKSKLDALLSEDKKAVGVRIFVSGVG
jgi:Fe-S cluster assembly iron-binding protein IscA